MALTTQNTRFLGVDTRMLAQAVGHFWQAVQQMPLFTWLAPSVRIRVLAVDGSASVWEAGSSLLRRPHAALQSANFTAIEIPEEIVLLQELSMPAVSASELHDAVALEARSNSPFPWDDLVWGYVHHPLATGALQVSLVLASRQQVERHMLASTSPVNAKFAPEAWVLAGLQKPVVLQGFGELRRTKHGVVWRRLAYALLLSALGLLVAIAVTPTLQLHFRALEAQKLYEAERLRTAPAAAKRTGYLAAAERLTQLAQLSQGHVDALDTMYRLTQIMPDDSFLATLQVQGQKITLTGQTSNAAALMQHLGTQPGVSDVKALSASTRMPGTTKDSFSIELVIAAAAEKPAVKAAMADPSATPVSAAAVASAPVPAGAASAPMPAAPASASPSLLPASAVPLPAASRPAAVASKPSIS